MGGVRRVAAFRCTTCGLKRRKKAGAAFCARAPLDRVEEAGVM